MSRHTTTQGILTFTVSRVKFQRDQALTAQLGSLPVDSNPLAHTPAMSNGVQIAQDASFIPVDWH
jgi:hypothetical protein